MDRPGPRDYYDANLFGTGIQMRRRELLTTAAAGALAGCAAEETDCGPGTGPAERFDWKLVTTWPPNFPGLGTGVLRMAEMIRQASAGRLNIKVYAAGELVPAFEVFDTVSSGTAEMGHGSAYYWKGKTEAAQFFTSIPFGISAMEMNGWLYHAGGLELYQGLYEAVRPVAFPGRQYRCADGRLVQTTHR
jgi:TRAP-type mannitol/chloroaromatic compound transport system substrate-binding protein